MERKTTREMKKLVKEIYGKDMRLMGMSETREAEGKDLLWDSLVFKNSVTKEELHISFTDFEDIGYMTNEYNHLGDTPTNFTNWDLLDKKLNVKQL